MIRVEHDFFLTKRKVDFIMYNSFNFVFQTTPKFLKALSHGIPIVTPKYWHEFIENGKFPDAEECVPAIDTQQSNEFTPEMLLVNAAKKELIANHVFVFPLAKHMEKPEVIRLTGGQCVTMGHIKDILIDTNQHHLHRYR